MSYSLDFRLHVLAVKAAEDLTFKEASSRFAIGIASLVRWSKNPKPKSKRNKPATKIDMDALKKDIEEYPDAYQYERAQRFGVTTTGIWHALKRLKVTYKKNPQPSQVGSRKAVYILPKKIKGFKSSGRSLVFIDESGFSHDMPRTHGYAPKGKRCYGSHDWGAKGRTNVIGALLGGLLLTVSLFQTTINTAVFNRWIEQDLIPKLPPQCVLIMDNASFHKSDDMTNALLKAGHLLLYLPPYSPDLNPIEHKWAQAKAKRKKLNCDIQQLFQNHNI